ncbi:hypothetical protein O181_003913 [Austropuccinia psidii MF-1]|uniref:Uncharacterized protein n=1 Tax=Austropuccinia psidii MF-1 TaxID=1389203 RepID=A0A9Q3GE06_9BASI|nr:hypothetical protein [Austropuccinia psidii MF-1]
MASMVHSPYAMVRGGSPLAPKARWFPNHNRGPKFHKTLRTEFHLSKSRSRNPTPILKEDFLAHQSGNPWRQSEDHSRIPITWPCTSWVGNFIQGYSKGHSKRLDILSTSFQGIKYFNTLWTTQLVHTGVNQSNCMYLAQLGQFTFHCGNSIRQFKFQDGQICIDPIQTIQLVTHLPGSVPQPFTYTGHLPAPGDFFCS